MQRIAGLELPARIKGKPALGAVLLWPAVPGNAERLRPSWERNQILLQRVDPEGVGDRIAAQRTVRAVGPDQELGAVAEKGGCDPEMLELRAREITEHRCRRGRLHRRGLVRTLPGIELGRVAITARLGADKSDQLIGSHGARPGQRQHSSTPPARPP